MVHVYSSSNTTLPIGRVADYNNTNPARLINIYRTLAATPSFSGAKFPKTQNNSFASLIYGDGPYSLNSPNVTSKYLAQNIDCYA